MLAKGRSSAMKRSLPAKKRAPARAELYLHLYIIHYYVLFFVFVDHEPVRVLQYHLLLFPICYILQNLEPLLKLLFMLRATQMN